MPSYLYETLVFLQTGHYTFPVFLNKRFLIEWECIISYLWQQKKTIWWAGQTILFRNIRMKLPDWSVHAISMSNYPFIKKTNGYPHVHAMSMHHGCLFEYFKWMDFSALILPWTLHGHFNSGYRYHINNVNLHGRKVTTTYNITVSFLFFCR